MNENMTFEDGMEQLEALARALESGQMSLEDSFAAYEKAVALRNRLKEMLDEGDRRIRVLTEAGESALPGGEEA